MLEVFTIIVLLLLGGIGGYLICLCESHPLKKKKPVFEKINGNVLAQQVMDEDQGKISVSAAQTKDVIRATKDVMNREYSNDQVSEWVRR